MRRVLVCLTLLTTFSACGFGDEAPPLDDATLAPPVLEECCAYEADGLVRMSDDELECLFRSLPAVPLPEGYYRGTVIWSLPGVARKPASKVTRLFWQGKWICPEQGTMWNRAFTKRIVPADIMLGPSWVDGCEAVIFDYSDTPAKFARSARDEVRQVCPGLYLGVFWNRKDCQCPKRLSFFVVEACGCH